MLCIVPNDLLANRAFTILWFRWQISRSGPYAIKILVYWIPWQFHQRMCVLNISNGIYVNSIVTIACVPRQVDTIRLPEPPYGRLTYSIRVLLMILDLHDDTVPSTWSIALIIMILELIYSTVNQFACLCYGRCWLIGRYGILSADRCWRLHVNGFLQYNKV